MALGMSDVMLVGVVEIAWDVLLTDEAVGEEETEARRWIASSRLVSGRTRKTSACLENQLDMTQGTAVA